MPTVNEDGAIEAHDDSQPQTLTLTKDELLLIISHAIRELKKPDEAAQKKLDIETARRKQDAEQMYMLAKTQEQEIKRRQDACTHTKENGERSIGGQIHSDGKIHPICLHCQKMFDPFDAPREMMATGITTGGFTWDSGMV